MNMHNGVLLRATSITDFYYRQTLCNVDDYKYFSGAVSESDAI